MCYANFREGNEHNRQSISFVNPACVEVRYSIFDCSIQFSRFKMILYKFHFVVITTLLALQTSMNVSTADISGGQHSRRKAHGSLKGNIKIPRRISDIKYDIVKTQGERAETLVNNNGNTSMLRLPSDDINLKKRGQGENISAPAKLQDIRDNNQKTEEYKDDIKPGTFEDFIDTNIKKIIIGMIVIVALIIITLVCCCVYCSATVFNRSTRRRDNKSKQDVHSSKEQNDDHETPPNVHICSSRAL